jgi:molybdenum cofactor cytidylyltransferase
MACTLKSDDSLYSRININAILLAAGSGSRMGHRPKSLLELDGVPLIRRQLLALSEAGVDEVVVILGHYANRIEDAIKGLPVRLVRNPDPDAGQVSSLRLGLQSVSARLDAVLVALADQPLINSQDIKDLICAYKNRPLNTHVVQPLVNGQPGNPVMFSKEVRKQILLGDDNMGCRQWQLAHADQVHPWTSSNAHYCTDVDTHEDIAELTMRTGLQLKWPAHLI